MAVLRSALDAHAPAVADTTDEALSAIDRVVDYAFWQLMLADDFRAAERDIDLLCHCIRLRWAAVKASARRGTRNMSPLRSDQGIVAVFELEVRRTTITGRCSCGEDFNAERDGGDPPRLEEWLFTHCRCPEVEVWRS